MYNYNLLDSCVQAPLPGVQLHIRFAFLPRVSFSPVAGGRVKPSNVILLIKTHGKTRLNK